MRIEIKIHAEFARIEDSTKQEELTEAIMEDIKWMFTDNSFHDYDFVNQAKYWNYSDEKESFVEYILRYNLDEKEFKNVAD